VVHGVPRLVKRGAWERGSMFSLLGLEIKSMLKWQISFA